MGVDLILQRAQLRLFRRRLLVHSLHDELIHFLHHLPEMMGKLAHFSTSIHINLDVEIASAHLFHRVSQDMQFFQN
ncbi:hypothetical protein D3C86_2076290 [compost metagenome]